MLRSLLVLPCLLGILALSPLFAQTSLQAGVAARTSTTGHTLIAARGGKVIPQMPGPNK
jgi:hypothetical protein